MASDALAWTEAAVAKIFCLEGELHGALRASSESEVFALRVKLRMLADGVRILEHCFKAAWESTNLGWVDLPP